MTRLRYNCEGRWLCRWLALGFAFAHGQMASADITSISGVFSGQAVVIDVVFSNEPQFDSLWDFQLFIDTDDNSRTGYGAGYELLVRDVGIAGISAALYDAEPGDGPNGWGLFIGGTSVQMVSQRHLRVEIAIASDGVPTGFFRYAFETYIDGELVDAVYNRRTTSTTGQDCNQNGIDDERDIELGESDDCNNNSIPDECEPDCDRDGVPDACAIIRCQPGQSYCKDCNGNGSPDICDLIDGISEDCDLDGVPDECITAAVDCNANSIPDTCDLFDGISADFNENGVPDECEVVAGGSRYLIVTPYKVSEPVAILISGNPFDPDVSCLSQYVQFNGTLGVDPDFSFADGQIVYVRDVEIQPATTYFVQYDTGDENFAILSSPLVVTTWLWADTDHNYDVNFIDIARIVNGFSGAYTTTLRMEMVDITGTGIAWCRPDGNVSFTDISASVDAFSTGIFPCVAPCP